MTLPQPDPLDELLAQHLTATLEPQRGRAADAFRKHLAAGDPPLASNHKLVPARALWWYAGVPSAIAASLALVLTFQALTGRNTQVISPTQTTTVADRSINMNETELTRQLDGGVTIIRDNTPMRLVREQRIRQSQWTDPEDHAVYSVTQPIEKANYIKLQPY